MCIIMCNVAADAMICVYADYSLCVTTLQLAAVSPSNGAACVSLSFLVADCSCCDCSRREKIERRCR